jgi:hypothetical protein
LLTTAVLEQTVHHCAGDHPHRAVNPASVVCSATRRHCVPAALLAVKVGRYIDQGVEAKTAAIGAGLYASLRRLRVAVVADRSSSSPRCSVSVT